MIQDTIKANDGFIIPISYFPVKEPKGLIQIVHGSWEHKGRYYEMIQYLNDAHFSCIISDNRGHGEAINDHYPSGHMENLDETIEDLYLVSQYIKNKNPGLQLTLIGHSLGSLYARIYLQKHDDMIANLILSGTVFYRKVSKMGDFMVSLFKLFNKGKDFGRSKTLAKMSGLDKPSNEWISYNQDNLINIKNDPLMGNSFTLKGYKILFQANKEIGKIKHFQIKNKDLKILSVTGKDDPITGKEKGLKSSIYLLKKIGYTNIESIVYENMMHEIFQEKEKAKVFDDIIHFICK